jgi:D-glycero-D-manno-heptose 1,7-bisphosphate phosphatase
MAYPLDAGGVVRGVGELRRGGRHCSIATEWWSRRISPPRQDVVICARAAAVISAANASAVPVVLVTNQAGIGRGYYGWAEFHAVQEAIRLAIAQEGAHFDAVYACPHHRDGQGAFAHPDHPARKPNPGMLQRAAAALDIDMARSWLVGDRAGDIEAARRAGLAGALHVLTGYGQVERAAAMALSGARFDVRGATSIADALTLPLFERAPR